MRAIPLVYLKYKCLTPTMKMHCVEQELTTNVIKMNLLLSKNESYRGKNQSQLKNIVSIIENIKQNYGKTHNIVSKQIADFGSNGYNCLRNLGINVSAVARQMSVYLTYIIMRMG